MPKSSKTRNAQIDSDSPVENRRNDLKERFGLCDPAPEETEDPSKLFCRVL
jgi:hypothetical protein